MPVYEYACTECGHQLEVRQSFTDDALTTCPQCSGRLRKLLSPVGVVFKGSGFYRTDSRAAAGQDRSADGKSGADGSGTASGADSGAGGSDGKTAGSGEGGGGGGKKDAPAKEGIGKAATSSAGSSGAPSSRASDKESAGRGSKPAR